MADTLGLSIHLGPQRLGSLPRSPHAFLALHTPRHRQYGSNPPSRALGTVLLRPEAAEEGSDELSRTGSTCRTAA